MPDLHSFMLLNLLFSLTNILALAPTLIMMKSVFENEYFRSKIDYFMLYLFILSFTGVWVCFALAIGKGLQLNETRSENWSSRVGLVYSQNYSAFHLMAKEKPVRPQI